MEDSECSDEFDLDSDLDSDSDSLLSTSLSSASSDSFCYASDSQVPILPPFVFCVLLVNDLHLFNSKPRHSMRNPSELRSIEETIAAIRLRTRHHDPYEEWERQTRKDAFVRGYLFVEW